MNNNKLSKKQTGSGGGSVHEEQQVNADTLSTLDALSRHKRNQQQAIYGFYPQLAVNTYISNQVRGKNIDQTQSLEIDSLIDVCL